MYTFIKKLHPRIILGLIKKYPLVSLLISIGLLFSLIAAGNIFFKPQTIDTAKEPIFKEVKVFQIGTSPKFSTQAQVEKTGVIKIVSLTGGVVQSVNVKEGANVRKGTNLINLVSNYQGGNAAALQTALARKQLQMVQSNQDSQKDIIFKQKELAEISNDNTDRLRDISNQSVEETRSLVDSNQSILNSIGDSIKLLEETNINGANAAAILQSRQLQNQLQGAQNQIRASLRGLEYQSDTNNPPTQLAEIQKELTLKQLDLQEKSLQLTKEISQLQISLAAVGESLFHPVSPFAGIVQRVYVRPGQVVSPGVTLMEISGKDKGVNIVARVPADIAKRVTNYEDSTLHIKNTPHHLRHVFKSDESTDGQLYTILFNAPEDYSGDLTDGEYLNVDLPIGYPDTGTTIKFIPIDSVFQTQEKSIIYLVENDKAIAREVSLGQVYGSFVEITSGLQVGEKIILNRNITEGDNVKVQL